MSKIVRAIAALGMLLTLVIGVPVVLAVMAGWPLPSQVPDVGNMITMVRQNNIQADFVVKTIALVVWFAWIQLMAAVIWEMSVNVPRLLGGRRQRPAPLVANPVANGVARLFSTILTAGLLSTTASQPAIALTSSQVDLSPDASSLSLDASRVAAPAATPERGRPEVQIASVWVAEGDDSLWDIAEQAIGDGSAVSLILQMNPALDAASALPSGTAVRLPSGSRVPASRLGTAASNASNAPAPPSANASPGPAIGERITASAVDQYIVQVNDGMWNVAEALLGDGSRHAELHEMVVGQEVAPGIVFSSATSVIHEGWVFTLGDQHVASGPDEHAGTSAADISHTVVVGDTLSEIAELRLGDADAWPQIFDHNAGREMADGRTFDDPHLILPGWRIDVPGRDAGAATEPDPPATVSETGAEITEDTGTEVVDRPGDREQPAAPSDVIDPNQTDAPADLEAVELPAGAPTPAASTTGTTTTTTPAGTGSGGGAADERPAASSKSPSPIRIEHAALLAAGILSLVGVRRRQRLRSATPRARVPAPPPDIVATERRLRTVDAGERSLRVDVAIRAAAYELIDTEAQIGAVLIDHDGGIEMRLTAGADLTSPWVPIGDDRQWWQLAAATPIELLGEAARRVGTPCVALVQLGVADGSDVLIDVEACGTLAVVAPGGHADEVVTALAAGLATSPYAEIAHLITVAVADAALVGHRNAHAAGTSAEALELAASFIGSIATADRSTFALRCLRTGGEMWEPAIVVVGDTDTGPAPLPTDLPTPGRGVGLIATSRDGNFDSSGTRLVGSTTGWQFVGFGTSIDLVPVGMTNAELEAVSELVEDASAPLVLDDELTWAGDFDLEEHDVTADGETTLDGPPHGLVRRSDDPAVVEASAAFEPSGHRIMVRLMGDVEVVSHDDRHGTFERSKTVELIAWLATHRSSSTRSAARTALWELDVRDATFANVVSEARRALARLVTPPGNDEWVGRTLTEQLPLHDGVVTDADLIRERLDAARLQPPAQAIETLTPAAELIRNIPFAGTSYLWPDAEGITSNLVLLATGVSTELAGHALSIGDIDLVFWATGQGLKVLPGHEELIGLRMQAHARAGDLAGVRQEWESYERVIVADAWSDGEPAPKLLALRHELLTSPS